MIPVTCFHKTHDAEATNTQYINRKHIYNVNIQTHRKQAFYNLLVVWYIFLLFLAVECNQHSYKEVESTWYVQI